MIKNYFASKTKKFELCDEFKPVANKKISFIPLCELVHDGLIRLYKIEKSLLRAKHATEYIKNIREFSLGFSF